jgi:hypothetical protein
MTDHSLEANPTVFDSDPCTCTQETRFVRVEVKVDSIEKALNNQTRRLAVVVGAIAALAPYFGPALEKLASQVAPLLATLGLLG